MTRKPWTPSAEDVRLLSGHLVYEVQMAFGLVGVLVGTRLAVSNQIVHNAALEAFTIHLRQLIDFFWVDRSERPSSRDAFASDYFAPGEWAKLRPERPGILDEALRHKVGWGVAHMTYGRAWSTIDDKQWDPIALARALAPAVICFTDYVDPAKLDPADLAQFKPLAESLQSMRPPGSATATTAS